MDNPVVSAPEYKGYLGGMWHKDKWSVSAGLMQVSGLYTAVGQNETKESFNLLNATVNYSVCPKIKLWVKGENLLAQKYQMIADMPMPRATFMGGVNVEF